MREKKLPIYDSLRKFKLKTYFNFSPACNTDQHIVSRKTQIPLNRLSLKIHLISQVMETYACSCM